MTPNAPSGTKQAVLTSFLTQLKRQGVNPKFTLSDKDWAEINAMRAVWAEVLHEPEPAGEPCSGDEGRLPARRLRGADGPDEEHSVEVDVRVQQCEGRGSGKRAA